MYQIKHIYKRCSISLPIKKPNIVIYIIISNLELVRASLMLIA